MTVLSDHGRIARNGGSVALRERLIALFEMIRRDAADIEALWRIHKRAQQGEAGQ